jgi:acyl-CoA reductase-like NAD-dependent aldehyde dehydrogenase
MNPNINKNPHPSAASVTNDPMTQSPTPEMPQNAPICPTNSTRSDSEPLADLTPLQIQALELILSAKNDTAICKQLQIDRKTLYRWKTENPAFRDALHRRRAQLLDEHADRIRVLLKRALDTIEDHIQDSYAPTSHRAARTLLYLSRIGHHITPNQNDQ